MKAAVSGNNHISFVSHIEFLGRLNERGLCKFRFAIPVDRSMTNFGQCTLILP